MPKAPAAPLVYARRVYIDPLRLREHIHGHLGWLAAAALAHPAIVLRARRGSSPGQGAWRPAHLSVALGAAMPTLAGALGLTLYPAYRTSLRQEIFAQAPTVGYLFERKEHLAFGAIFLAWAGAAGYVGAVRARGEVRQALNYSARVAFVAAAACAFVAASLGMIVASYKTF